MSQFERDLRESLRQREPPPGFAEKVLARTRESEARRPLWTWLAAAAAVAAVVLMVVGGSIVQEQRRQAENQRAKEQLMAALRITGTKLRDVQLRLAAIQQRAVQRQLDQ